MSSATHFDIAKMKILAALIIGVALLGVASSEDNKSEATDTDERPIRDQENVGKRQDTPEVVLQLKYDRGELNRIYLTQFRKPKKSWNPSVSVQTNLCEDLCHAGLGGEACGPNCYQLLPIGLKTALVSGNASDVTHGQPRVSLCPALCNNYLGLPLCQCQRKDEAPVPKIVNWGEVCDAYCMDDYHLAGCPPCSGAEVPLAAALSSSRALGTTEGWQTWCNVQCPQGNGGLACNCDRTPFR